VSVFAPEDASAFLADMGVPCVAGATTFRGILEQPDQVLGLGRVSVMSTEFELSYVSSAVTLTRGQAVTVAGRAFTVREAPRLVDDGLFSVVPLSEV